MAGEEVRLTPTEYELLKVLVAAPGQGADPRHAAAWVWGDQYGAEDQYLRVYIAHLRKKLEADPAGPRYIVTEPGVGYRLLVEE